MPDRMHDVHSTFKLASCTASVLTWQLISKKTLKASRKVVKFVRKCKGFGVKLSKYAGRAVLRQSGECPCHGLIY